MEREIIGIVGSEAAKFTDDTKEIALETIARILNYGDNPFIEACSGECHLGGIDKWTKEICEELGIPFTGFPPKRRNWNAYRARNIQIAEASRRVVCITVRELPPNFNAGGWEYYCYHCKTNSHIKSGGCWTVKYARSIGKQGEIIVV